MKKAFADFSDLAAWLNNVLATDRMEAVYEEIQIQLGDVCIPLGNTHHRRTVRDRLLESLAPVGLFLTWETVHTLERSDCRMDFFRYQADDLLNDLYMDGNPPIVTILTFTDGLIVRHELYVEEHHTQGLSLEQLWRTCVLQYFAESVLPFDYILTGNYFCLTDRVDGCEKRITCHDTNIYERAYCLWAELSERHLRMYRQKERAS